MKPVSTFALVLVLITASIEGRTQQTDTLEWTVLLGGNKAGFLKKWKNPDGSFTEWSQYNDRGRGDSTVSNYRYDSQGYLESIDAKGVDYMKKPVYEKFKIADGQAFWENNSEKEGKKLEQKAEYVTLSIATGTSYKNYFNSADKTIQLLPSGSSKLTVIKEHTAKDGKKIRLASTVGARLTPSYFWIDENDEFFSYAGDWFAYARKGYEYLNEELLSIQNVYKDRYFEEIAQRIPQAIKTGLAITDANLFDPKTGDVRPHTTVLIENGRIKVVNDGKLKVPKGYQSIDAKGRFVMPGLWDMHVHYGDASQGLLHLACGVTNVRDMGNSLDLLDRKKQIDGGKILGPRIQVMSGFIDGAGKYAGPIGEKVNSIEEGKVAVKKYADLGYQQIKLYSSLNPEWVKPLAEEAKKYNLRVSGHIPAHMLATEAIEAGYHEIHHMNMLFLHFYGKELDTRTPARFTTVAQKAAFFDFENDEFKILVQKLKQWNITVDPTVTVFEDMFIGEAGKTSPSFESTAHRLPLEYQRSLKTGSSLQIPNGLEETYKNSFGNMLKMVKVLHDNGITLVSGTDGFAGFTLHRELENYVRAGIPNKEVLKIATITSASVAGKANLYGSVEKGKAADLIIIDGDPTKNIGDIRKVEVIIKDKDIYQSKELLSSISIKYFK
jgi:imidazolonepropionase-like amidohydrolase